MTAAGLQKAFFTTEKKPPTEKISCLFNPETLSVSMKNNWNGPSRPGLPVSEASFGGAGSGSMDLKLLFDTTDTGQPVTSLTAQLMELMDITVDLGTTTEDGDKIGRPQWVVFHWGSFYSFKAVITSLTVNYTYFSSAGTPLRADVALNLLQYQADDAYGRQNPTSGTPRPHKVHRTQPGETLDRIAARYYGDSTRWRAVAVANGIRDPLAVAPGTLLAIPRDDGL